MIPNGLQDIIKFYGNPSQKRRGKIIKDGSWERQNIVSIQLPFDMSLAWATGSVIDTVRLHKNVAGDFKRRMQQVWAYARKHIKETKGYQHTTQFYDHEALRWLHEQGLTLWGGGFNWRQKRSCDELSVHSFGAAFDIDPGHNAMGSVGRMPQWFIDIWTKPDENGDRWIWGGKFSHRDPMHLQFCKGY